MKMMKISPKITSLKWVLVLITLAFSLTAHLYVRPYMLELLLSFLTSIILVGAWNILSGFTGYMFFGAAGFYGLGSYILAVTDGILSYFAAILMSGVSCFVIAFLIGIPFLKIRGAYFATASFALGLLFANIILYYEQVFTRTQGRMLSIQPTSTTYMVLVVLAFITLIVAYLIKNSRFGYGLLAIKGNEDVAEVIGVNTFIYKCLAFSISAFFMGALGAAMATHGGYIDTHIVFSSAISTNTLVMGILGGSGSIRGGLISAVVLSYLFEVLGARGDPYFFLVSLGIAIFLTIFFMPGGIEQGLQRIEKKLKKK